MRILGVMAAGPGFRRWPAAGGAGRGARRRCQPDMPMPSSVLSQTAIPVSQIAVTKDQFLVLYVIWRSTG